MTDEQRSFKMVECSNCKWQHFAVTRAYAEREVATFKAYFDKLSKQKQIDYYGGKTAGIEEYERCMRCGASYKLLREPTYKLGEGHTVNPMIYEPEASNPDAE